jgi:hypothetical protein
LSQNTDRLNIGIEFYQFYLTHSPADKQAKAAPMSNVAFGSLGQNICARAALYLMAGYSIIHAQLCESCILL